MLEITKNGIIRVNRGDNFELPIIINIGTQLLPIDYKFSENDILYLGIMEPNQLFEEAILKKKLTHADVDSEGNMIAKFEPNDTVCLIPGLYYYQIKAKIYKEEKNDYEIKTVCKKQQFI